ncbi:MAG: hypothetical protein KC646_17780 [Candidatus Cloacimonetes bacterium]|nr:hypothetical protein [Candidatus Cloacimonadota bacterium]
MLKIISKLNWITCWLLFTVYFAFTIWSYFPVGLEFPVAPSKQVSLFVESLQQGKFEKFLSLSMPEIRNHITPSIFQKMCNELPKGLVEFLPLYYEYTNLFEKGKFHNFRLYVQAGTATTFVEVRLTELNNSYKIAAFNIKKMIPNYLQTNRFGSNGLSFTHLCYLPFWIGIHLFWVYMIYYVYKNPWYKLKGYWFILIGIGWFKLLLLWPDAQIKLIYTSIGTINQVFTAVGLPYYVPFELKTFLPVGAIITFLCAYFFDDKKSLTMLDDNPKNNNQQD